jgi:hypothetical protein
MLTCYATSSFHHKALHVVIELFNCGVGHVLMLVVSILHLHNPVAAQTDALKTFLESSMVSRRWCHQSAACGATSFSTASTRLCYGFETFSHVIRLYYFLYALRLGFGIH